MRLFVVEGLGLMRVFVVHLFVERFVLLDVVRLLVLLDVMLVSLDVMPSFELVVRVLMLQPGARTGQPVKVRVGVSRGQTPRWSAP